MKKIKDLIRKLIFLIRINWVKTILINFKTLPLKQAVKFPIVILCKIKLLDLSGSITIDGSIFFSKIKIGGKVDFYPENNLPINFHLMGNLHFRGECLISAGSHILVKSNAKLDIGEACTFNSGVVIRVLNSCVIGRGTRVTRGCSISDSNFHYIKEIETGKIRKPNGIVRIGEFCWVNPNSVINKGTMLPDHTIVTQGSFLNKDYTNIVPEYSLIGGSPIKIIKQGIQRVFDPIEENKMRNAFIKADNKQDYIVVKSGIFYDDIENLKAFIHKIKK
jgi:acetyltransferase-like isoleucine patch superfamily enzyme